MVSTLSVIGLPMNKCIYRYTFGTDIAPEDLEATLVLALVGAAALHGDAQVRLEVEHIVNEKANVLQGRRHGCLLLRAPGQAAAAGRSFDRGWRISYRKGADWRRPAADVAGGDAGRSGVWRRLATERHSGVSAAWSG